MEESRKYELARQRQDAMTRIPRLFIIIEMGPESFLSAVLSVQKRYFGKSRLESKKAEEAWTVKLILESETAVPIYLSQ